MKKYPPLLEVLATSIRQHPDLWEGVEGFQYVQQSILPNNLSIVLDDKSIPVMVRLSFPKGEKYDDLKLELINQHPKAYSLMDDPSKKLKRYSAMKWKI